MGLYFTVFVLVVGIGLLVLGARAVIVWRGAWRWVALLPILGVVGTVVKIFIEINADPTSHNLWPFEVLGVVVIAGAVLGALELIRIGATRFGRERRA